MSTPPSLHTVVFGKTLRNVRAIRLYSASVPATHCTTMPPGFSTLLAIRKYSCEYRFPAPAKIGRMTSAVTTSYLRRDSSMKLRPSSMCRWTFGRREHVVVDAVEEARAACHGARELDDVHVHTVVDADGAGRGAAAEADHEDVARLGMQHHRQMADGAVHECHDRPGARLVVAVDGQRHFTRSATRRRPTSLRRLPRARSAAGRDSAGPGTARTDRPTPSHSRRKSSDASKPTAACVGRRNSETASSSSPPAKLIAPSAMSDDRLPSNGSRKNPAATAPRIPPPTFSE